MSNKRRGPPLDRREDARPFQKRRVSSPTANDTSSHCESPNTIYDLIEARANEVDLQDQPSVLYPDYGTNYMAYSATQIHQLSRQAAGFYNTLVPQRLSSTEKPLVVALLGPSNFEYFISLAGLSRLGHTLLLLSPRISEEAHVSLLTATDTRCLFVHDSQRDMARRIQTRLKSLSVHDIASRDDIARCNEPLLQLYLNPEVERKNVAFIIHSSGSTSLPKPNYSTHAAALDNFRSQFCLVGFNTMPLFHMQGLSCVFRSITNRKPIYMYNASLPLRSQTLETVLKDHLNIQILYGVPYVLKLLADSDEGIRLSKRLDVLLCGGGACPKPVGDKLARNGVYVVSHIGASETGQLMNSHRPRSEIDEWDWMRPSSDLQKYLRWEPYDPSKNIFEMVVLEGWPSKIATNREDGAYATKDLWERHPRYPEKNAWRYYARKDDTIVLSNGEKANPVQFEDLARQSPKVQDAVVFGSQKPALGMFVIPVDHTASQEDVISEVWTAVQPANRIAPAHAQLARDMIRLMPSKDLSRIRRTDKSNIIRPAFYEEFAVEIDAAYRDVPATGGRALDLDDLIDFLISTVRAMVQTEQRESVSKEVDLFSLGLDSLQSTQLRSAIIKNIDFGGQVPAENFVFDHPTIHAMATELVHMRLKQANRVKPSREQKMEELVEKYSKDFPEHEPASREPDEHVVITGATGSLGAHIVAQLASRQEVSSVCCLIRADTAERARKRLHRSLEERKLHVDTTMVQIVAYRAGEPELGLSRAEYTGLTEATTCVIHCGWNVYFNLSLESFEQDCIKTTRDLIDLCLSSGRGKPAKLVVCSSISAVAATPGGEIQEEACTTMTFAQSMGYAQSKLVAENICLNASKVANLPCGVLRIAQIVGDINYGIWNRSEVVPMIFQSARTIGALPMLDEECSWLPVDIVAKAVVEVSIPTSQGHRKDGLLFDVNHIVNANTFHWTNDLLPMLRTAGLEFEAVSPADWLQRLGELTDPSINPPYKLIDFFRAKYGRDQAPQIRKYSSAKARHRSSALSEYGRPDQELVDKFVRHILDI